MAKITLQNWRWWPLARTHQHFIVNQSYNGSVTKDVYVVLCCIVFCVCTLTIVSHGKLDYALYSRFGNTIPKARMFVRAKSSCYLAKRYQESQITSFWNMVMSSPNAAKYTDVTQITLLLTISNNRLLQITLDSSHLNSDLFITWSSATTQPFADAKNAIRLGYRTQFLHDFNGMAEVGILHMKKKQVI